MADIDIPVLAILYDNMKKIVFDRKLKASKSKFNSDFVRFAEYYGFSAPGNLFM